MLTGCPKCGYQFDTSSGRAGLRAVCPRCQQTFDAFSAGETISLAPGARGAIGPGSPVGAAVGQRFHEYRIVGEIGRGAMGVVYKAVQETLDRPVALKVIQAGEAAGHDEIQRFLQEATAAARLRHPNIVTIYELDVQEGVYYYTMDFIEGRDLGELIEAEGMPPRQAAIIALKVARALAHAHSKHIVHRDLKPGNIVIEESGEPVITDFGLAFDLRRAEGAPDAAGTPAYMAPEQVLGLKAKVGPACDIYSLGALLYEMLTGVPPFQAESIREIFEAIASESPRDPRELRSDLAPELCAVVDRCLRKDPDERFASAAELAEALAAWLAK